MSIDTEQTGTGTTGTAERAPVAEQEPEIYRWGTHRNTGTAHLWFSVTGDHWWSLCGQDMGVEPNLMGDQPHCKICVNKAGQRGAKTFGYQTLPLPSPEVIDG